MSDDGFFREVNEELRQDQAKALWSRYGALFIGIAVVVVIATGGYVAYDYWQQSRADKSGDAFSHALELASEGKTDEAVAEFRTLQEEGNGAYPLLARMRTATALAAKGDSKGAVAGFDTVAADGSAPDAIRDIARLRAAYILVDHGSYDDVAKRVESLTGDDNPMRHAARQALGLAAWKAGKTDDATDLFQEIVNDQSAPRNIQQQAQMMTELIAGSGSAS